MTDVSAVVVGSGLSGCAAALALHERGHSVMLIGDSRVRRSWAGEALPPGAGDLVRSLFGEEALDSAVHREAHGSQGAWGSDELVLTDFIANPLGDGWHLDRGAFDAGLTEIVERRGVEVVRARATNPEPIADGWSLDAADRSITGAWLVDASGRGGPLVPGAQSRRTRFDKQMALIAVAHAKPSALAYTTIEAVSDGWWYSTPLPNGRAVVALMIDRDQAPPASERAIWWRVRLDQTRHIGGLVELDDRVAINAYPAETSCRKQLNGHNWAAVGDSAITWDPLSSQGTITGILMGSRLGTAIADAADGDSGGISEWERDYRMLLEEHLSLRQHYWEQEQRWPESKFWSRRCGQPQEDSLRGPLPEA